MSVVHLVVESPRTLCGVNVQEKRGARHTEDPDLTTCQNCLKLLHGGQMGAPPPKPTKDEFEIIIEGEEEESSPTPAIAKIPVDHARMALINNMNLLENCRDKVGVIEMNMRVVMSFIDERQDPEPLMHFLQYFDAARVRLNWAISDLREVLDGKKEDEGYEPDAGKPDESQS